MKMYFKKKKKDVKLTLMTLYREEQKLTSDNINLSTYQVF